MDLRVPLSCVLGAPLAQRHAVPHRTLLLDATHQFVQYLTSNDTRLPQHPTLAVEARPAEEYETYVGEDVWQQQEGTASYSSDPAPCFDDVVQWVTDTLHEVGGHGDGVVLCGRSVVADDCGWAVFSRTPTLLSSRDVFIAMRNSSKFMRDVHHQLRRGASAASGPLKVEVTLAKALGRNQALEFRAFLPYRLHTSAGEVRAEAWEDHMYAGISQRATDVCFPILMAWDEATHDENYRTVMRHIRHARLLERALENSARLRMTLLRQVANISPAVGVPSTESAVVLLAVDLLFESPSLPVYLLSAAVRCFSHDGAKDPACAFPFILDNEAAGGTWEENNTRSTNTVADADAESGGGGSDESDDDEEVSWDSASFFRLFRDVANWNRHVEVWRQRGDAAAAGGHAYTSGTQKEQRFFVVASERDDLVTTKESLAKRGLPLEFLRPDLFKGDDNFMREWREKLMQSLTMAQQCRGS
ncbi:hypothetical protein TraAM80_06154 [Trypanosoma rangeli]|uniref:Uncharacterized protein n=1 Tax=Trypanosoma rangeli TaxID=5698 RepID=A0A422NBH7_TRYRA|nr:uncharacterized protein TraAM80_06154 [Trypanosoma rangeli]RNF02802.1 hypothetical protein TraAM80_06154 [Trypanosoma rangeli]|eukprot:RNF02802.1 hypothetical protein TraAM80_06154 [Trypanosoma rangeli]